MLMVLWEHALHSTLWFRLVRLGINPGNPLASKPFALSLSKGRSWFDRLTTNGFFSLQFSQWIIRD